MKKYSLVFLFLVGMIALFSACNDDETPTPPIVSIESLSGVFSMPQGDSIILKANVESPLETTLRWTVNGNEVSTDSIYTFTMNDLGNYEVKLTAINTDGETSATEPVEVYGKYKYGTFVLHEGAVYRGDVSSKLTFISPKGVFIDSVYQKENDGEALKIVCQDLFIFNGKMYIMSQRKALTVVNAETLKKEIIYEDEMSTLMAPTHLVVLDEDHIYIRDNKGVYLFKPSDKTLTFIEGTNGARKNTMALVDGKIFVTVGSNVVVIEKGNTEISQTLNFEGGVSGIIKSADKNLWVSDASGKISKVNVKDYTIQANELPEDVAKLLTVSYAAAPSITAKGDTLYISGLQSKIYRHIFSSKQTDLMVDVKDMVENVGIVYNTVAVNPVTGDVMLNSIKGYGADIAISNTSIFDFIGATPVLKANYENYLRYPAGTFFTYNFE